MVEGHLNNSQSIGVAGLLSATYHFMMNRIINRLAAEGYGDLSKTQLHVLARFNVAGMTLQQISEKVQISVYVVSNIIKMLITSGYVTEASHKNSDDGARYALTSRGHEAVTIVKSEEKTVETDWKQYLGSDQLTSIISSLETLFHATTHVKGNQL